MNELNDRRLSPRCPSCNGSAKYADDGESIRCRMSLCRQNHLELKCPRCGLIGHQARNYSDNIYHFTCSDCQKTFTKEDC